MPKVKSHSGAKKRFNKTGSGRIKRAHAYKSHILTKKSRDRKRRLRQSSIVTDNNARQIRTLIPYK